MHFVNLLAEYLQQSEPECAAETCDACGLLSPAGATACETCGAPIDHEPKTQPAGCQED